MPLYLNNKKPPTLFLHIPKTGGTTIENWLETVYGGTPLFLSKHKTEDIQSTPQHFGYKTLIQLLGSMNDSVLFKFAIVRNPYHRLESEFFYRIEQRELNLGRDPERFFSSWVCDFLIKAKACPAILDNHLRPQTFYHGNDVNVFKFEDGFDNIITRLADLLEVKPPSSIDSKKVGKKKTVLWSNKAIKIMNEVYRADFLSFNYDFNKQSKPTNREKIKLSYYQLIYLALRAVGALKKFVRTLNRH
jgi:hypothetical protein